MEVFNPFAKVMYVSQNSSVLPSYTHHPQLLQDERIDSQDLERYPSHTRVETSSYHSLTSRDRKIARAEK